MKLDCIEIHDLRLETIIGVNPRERKRRQAVVLNIRFHFRKNGASATDDLQHAINYRTVTKSVISVVENSAYFLLERLAEVVAETCLTNFAMESIEVRIEKPGALRFARSVAVVIERKRNRRRPASRRRI